MAGNKPQKKKGWRYRVDLGPLSIFLWGIFILFFMAWIFVLGIFVGRGFVSEKITDLSGIKGEITKLTKSIEVEGDKNSSQAPSGNPEETEPDFVFYEKLTTKKDEAKNNLNAKEAETGAIRSPSPRPAGVKSSGNQIKEVNPSPDSKGKSGSGQYTVQVASIAELINAEKTVKQLVEKGFDAYYYETTVKGKRYYRVRCGKFPDRAEAQKCSLRLEEKTGIKGYVTTVE